MNATVMWSPGISLEQIERDVILKAYAFYRENKTMTSRSLGIAVRTLEAKLERYAADDKIDVSKAADQAVKDAAFLHRCRNGGPAPVEAKEQLAKTEPVPEQVAGKKR